MPTGIPTRQAKAEIEPHPVIAITKISECSIQFKAVQSFLCFLFINSFWSVSSMK